VDLAVIILEISESALSDSVEIELAQCWMAKGKTTAVAAAIILHADTRATEHLRDPM
jgi:hypothetical protein